MAGPRPVETGHALDDSAADLRVQPQDVPLLRAQRAWLQQDPLAYPKLADVAEQRREHQLLSFPQPPGPGASPRRRHSPRSGVNTSHRTDPLSRSNRTACLSPRGTCCAADHGAGCSPVPRRRDRRGRAARRRRVLRSLPDDLRRRRRPRSHRGCRPARRPGTGFPRRPGSSPFRACPHARSRPARARAPRSAAPRRCPRDRAQSRDA